MNNLQAITVIVRTQKTLDDEVTKLVAAARSDGTSWQEIADAAGIPKATALYRWRDHTTTT